MNDYQKASARRLSNLLDGMLAAFALLLVPLVISSSLLAAWLPSAYAINGNDLLNFSNRIAVYSQELKWLNNRILVTLRPGFLEIWLITLFALCLLVFLEMKILQRFARLPRTKKHKRRVPLRMFLPMFDDRRVLRRKPLPPRMTLIGNPTEKAREKVGLRAEQLSHVRGWASDESNWNDACAQLREIDQGEAREIEKIIRSMIEHENTLMNNRIQWFLTITGFIITSLFLSSRIGAGGSLVLCLATLGLIVSFSFWVSLRVGGKAVEGLLERWQIYRRKAVPYFNEIGVIGSLLNQKNPLSLLVPWRVLPLVLVVFWLVVIGISLARPSDLRVFAPGTFVHLEAAKMVNDKQNRDAGNACPGKHYLLDTATGDLQCVDLKKAVP